jgi:uncharacterized protein involved in exopolysaccharide biosynthesis
MDDNVRTVTDDEVSVKDMILKIGRFNKFILTKAKLIVIVGIFCAALGLGYALFRKPIYMGAVSFALEDAKSAGGLGAYAGIASQFGLDVGGSGGVFTGDNLIELMKSRTMIEKSLLTTIDYHGKKITLAELYIQFNKLRDGWQGNSQLSGVQFLPGCDPSTFSLKQDSLISVFCKNLLTKGLTVDKVDKKLSIVTVKVSSANEIFSKYFPQSLVAQVSSFYIETKTKKSTQNVKILQHQTDSVRAQLNSAINGVASSVDVNPNANPTRQTLRVPAQHKQVDVQINSTVLAELEKNLEASKVALRNETPLFQIIDTPVLPLDVDKVGKLKGIIWGFFIGVLLATFWFSIKRVVDSILN